MDNQKALKKGMSEKVNPGGALAWLYRMYSLLAAMFTRDLPELEDVKESETEPFMVVAWTRAHAEARDQIKALEAALDNPRTDDPSFEFEVRTIRESIDFYRAILEEPDTIKILDVVRSDNPDRVDHMIASMAKRWKGLACLTLRGPGIALRCNRKVRRAAISRERRANRRADRQMLRLEKAARRRS